MNEDAKERAAIIARLRSSVNQVLLTDDDDETYAGAICNVEGHYLALEWGDHVARVECETLGLRVEWIEPSSEIATEARQRARALILEQAKQLTAQLSKWSREEKGYGP